MELDFTKMHGAGNDFIFIDDLSSDVELSAEQIRWLCDRNFGIGADGVILVQPPRNADSIAFMGYFNNDGSAAEMCGNGIRCFAKYLVDKGFVAAGDGRFVADTLAGRRQISFEVDDSGLMTQATVDMGQPILAPELIPTTLAATSQSATAAAGSASTGKAAETSGIGGSGETSGGLNFGDGSAATEPAVIDRPLPTTIGELRFTCVSMGNPHAVTFFDAADDAHADGSPSAVAQMDISAPGAQLETSAVFPQKANIEFAEVIKPGSSDSLAEINLRVWERGVGETLACGTGTCATVVAAVLSGRIQSRQALVHLPGGDLLIEWLENNHVMMTGPAATVFEGTIKL